MALEWRYSTKTAGFVSINGSSATYTKKKLYSTVVANRAATCWTIEISKGGYWSALGVVPEEFDLEDTYFWAKAGKSGAAIATDTGEEYGGGAISKGRLGELEDGAIVKFALSGDELRVSKRGSASEVTMKLPKGKVWLPMVCFHNQVGMVARICSECLDATSPPRGMGHGDIQQDHTGKLEWRHSAKIAKSIKIHSGTATFAEKKNLYATVVANRAATCWTIEISKGGYWSALGVVPEEFDLEDTYFWAKESKSGAAIATDTGEEYGGGAISNGGSLGQLEDGAIVRFTLFGDELRVSKRGSASLVTLKLPQGRIWLPMVCFHNQVGMVVNIRSDEPDLPLAKVQLLEQKVLDLEKKLKQNSLDLERQAGQKVRMEQKVQDLERQLQEAVADGDKLKKHIAELNPDSVWSFFLPESLVSARQRLTYESTATGGVEKVVLDANNEICAHIKMLFDSTSRGKTAQRIELLRVPEAARGFKEHVVRLGSGRGCAGPLNPANHSTPDFMAGVQRLKTCFIAEKPHTVSDRVNFVYSFHGTKHHLLHIVAKNGLRHLRSTDGGFFSAGSYTALESWYAAQYADSTFGCHPDADGNFVMLLCVTAVGAAYVVTLEADYVHPRTQPGFSDLYASDPGLSKAIKPGYDTHFVPVKYCGSQWKGATLNYDIDYQACPEGEAEAHEIVSASWDQVLPIAAIYFR